MFACVLCPIIFKSPSGVIAICPPCASKCFRIAFSRTVASDPGSDLSENLSMMRMYLVIYKNTSEYTLQCLGIYVAIYKNILIKICVNIPCKDCSSNSWFMADVIRVQAEKYKEPMYKFCVIKNYCFDSPIFFLPGVQAIFGIEMIQLSREVASLTLQPSIAPCVLYFSVYIDWEI